jgi:hypothetical protein
MMYKKKINTVIYLLLIVFLNASNNAWCHDNAYYYADEYPEQGALKQLYNGLTATVCIGLGTLSVYFGGRLCEYCLYSLAQKRYEPELDLLARAYYYEDAIQEELIPYVLEQHDLNNSYFLFNTNPYKNYPLLQYKNDLDWYINRLWFFRFFYLNSEKGTEILNFMEKLKRVRRYIVTDYRFVKEQRDFDKENRK